MYYKYLHRADLIAEIEAYKLNNEKLIQEEVEKRVAEREKELRELQDTLLDKHKLKAEEEAYKLFMDTHQFFFETKRKRVWNFISDKKYTPSFDINYHMERLKEALDKYKATQAKED
jgi:hypothetical protein